MKNVTTTGTLTDRIVQLDANVELPDNCRVSVSIEPIEQDSEQARAALQRFLNRADRRRFDSQGERFSRDELHERR